jgi:hypothetical protein
LRVAREGRKAAYAEDQSTGGRQEKRREGKAGRPAHAEQQSTGERQEKKMKDGKQGDMDGQD